MFKNRKFIISFIILAIIALISTGYFIYEKNHSIETLSKYGSRGNEVTQIQTKLKRWG